MTLLHQKMLVPLVSRNLLQVCPVLRQAKTLSCDWQKGWFSRDFWKTLVKQLCNYITQSVVSAIYKGSSFADQRERIRGWINLNILI